VKERVLVIKLGALGDLILCMEAFASLRAAHPDADIALLTAPSFASLGLSMPWFDRVLLDPRPKAWEPFKWFKLIGAVRSFAPTRVYDFQGKTRQTILFYAARCPLWSGAAPGCLLPRPWPPEKGAHYTDFLLAQLRSAGIEKRTPPDLSWLAAPMGRGSALAAPYALIVAGCAPDRLYKRWPPQAFARLVRYWSERGLGVAAVGTRADADAIASVRSFAPEVIDLSGQTTLPQLASLMRGADCVVGNDTGPVHLAAVLGAKTVALMSERVDPHWSAPRGPRAAWLQGRPLSALGVEEVITLLERL